MVEMEFISCSNCVLLANPLDDDKERIAGSELLHTSKGRTKKSQDGRKTFRSVVIFLGCQASSQICGCLSVSFAASHRSQAPRH